MSDDIKNNPKNMWDWYISAFIGLIGMLTKFKQTVAIPMSEEQKERLREYLKEIENNIE